MKIKKRSTLYVLFGLCCAAFAAYVLLTRGMWNYTPPVITVPGGVLQVSVYADRQELLRDVTAVDDEDGDVTDRLVVESVSDIYDRNKATVTYAAFDGAGNVSKAQRAVEYTDYSGPKFTLEEALIFREGGYEDVFDYIGAQDPIDGELDDRVKGTLRSGGDMIYDSGMYTVEFRVTNSLGDTAHLIVPVEVVPYAFTGTQLYLDRYLVYLKQGAAFDPMEYLDEDSAGRDVRVESDVNTDQPGVYSVTYTDRNGENYGKTRLIAVVEE